MTSWSLLGISGALALGAAAGVALPAPTPATATAPTTVTASAAVAGPPASGAVVVPGADGADPGAALHGCAVPDISGSGGCLSPAMGALMAQVVRAFGDLPVSCWDRRDGDPWSDHPKGRACDYTMGRIGTYAGPDDVRRGWVLAAWLRANAVPLQVNYVIWQGRIWSRAHDAEGWRPYTGGGHYPTSGPTNGHYDHVHVSTVD